MDATYRLKLSRCYRKMSQETVQHGNPYCEGEKCSRFPKCLVERIEAMVVIKTISGSAPTMQDQAKLRSAMVLNEDTPYKKEG